MKHDVKPAARLTMIFVLAIVLSGSVLAYFSINNISNLKELTEKKILEEQRELNARLTAEIGEILEIVTDRISHANILPGEMRDSLSKISADYDFLVMPFIIGKSGNFIYPVFEGISQRSHSGVFSARLTTAISAGEKAEFSTNDLRKAKFFYLSGLASSAGAQDSARALNALGRISFRMKAFNDAADYYTLIVNDFSEITDPDGFPYAYYALPQLVKLNDIAGNENIAHTVRLCLEKIETGSIPVNYSTEELAADVIDHLMNGAFHNPEDSAVISNLADRIRMQSRFISMYGSELKELVMNLNSHSYADAGNDFIIAHPVTGSGNEYFLLSTDHENTAGFLIDRDRLLNMAMETDLESGFQFEYRIEFPGSGNPGAVSNSLILTSQLIPFFPDQLLQISLVDEDLIQDLVRRRSWIYGIASLLLFVALCLGVVLILRDIAREKHLARLRADFISNVTHELKTPLTSIRMYAESLIMGRVRSEEKRKEYLEVVVHESDRLKGMINNILEFSKMENGSPEYHFVRTDLASVIKEATAEMSHWFSQEGFEITTELEEKILAEVDPEKMKQALGNLFSNAIKYSADIKKIFIRLFREGDHIIIEVEDRGIGIPHDKLSKIFEPFYRIGQEEGVSGTGLGLTVVKEIVEAHGGRISVTSKSGEGSKFVITLNQQAANSENNTGN